MIHSRSFVTESSTDLTLILKFFGVCFPTFWTLFCVLVWCQQSVSDVMTRTLKLSFALGHKRNTYSFHLVIIFLFFTLQCLSLWSELLIKYCSILEKGWSMGLTPSYFSLTVIGLFVFKSPTEWQKRISKFIHLQAPISKNPPWWPLFISVSILAKQCTGKCIQSFNLIGGDVPHSKFKLNWRTADILYAQRCWSI